MSTTPFAQVPVYLSLIISEHEQRPIYRAFLSVFLQGQVDLQNVMMVGNFDVDTAVGNQLDAIGARVGISRAVPTPLVGVYFSWDIAGLGWDQGTWQGAFDPDTGVTLLSDEAYRKIILARIAANHWDGTVAGAEAVWTQAFGAGMLRMDDHQDMTETITWIGPTPDLVTQRLVELGYFNMKPAGVALTLVVPWS